MKRVLIALFMLATPLAVMADNHGGIRNEGNSEVSMRCTLEGELSGTSVGLGFSIGELSGEAMFTCIETLTGDEYGRKVHVSIKSLGVGIGFASVKSATIIGTDIGLTSYDDIFDSYGLTVTGSIDIATGGVDMGVALKVGGENGGPSFGLQLLGREIVGLGIHARTNTLRIRNL